MPTREFSVYLESIDTDIDEELVSHLDRLSMQDVVYLQLMAIT